MVLLESDSENPQLQLLVGYALQNSGEISKARSLYQDMIFQNPHLPEAYNNLATIEMNAGNIERATELLQAAINSNQSYATAYKNLDKIYTASATEAYRRALSQKVEPEKVRLKIVLDSLTQVSGSQAGASEISSTTETSPEIVVPRQDSEIESRLKNLVLDWAKAWSQKNVEGYIDFYSTDFTQGLSSHPAWIEHRQKRINRAQDLIIDINDIQIRAITENRAIIEFKQLYQSRTFSDHVVKQLRLSLIDSEWKITDEQVLSVL